MPNIASLSAFRLPLTGEKLTSALPRVRTGMPSLDSIHSTTTFRSPHGTQYRILRSTETDEYESAATGITTVLHGPGGPTAAELTEAAKLKKPGDTYAGKDRQAAKLSIAKGPNEDFDDVGEVVASLTPDEDMINHDPQISTDQHSGRVEEEQRNVRVNAFLFACSRENDNDFHLIIGRDPSQTPEVYMTMEVSGLPPNTSDPAYAQLKSARDALKAYFGANLPQATYDFYDPPIPVTIQGSLFFDMTHASGQAPGPKSLKSRMPTIWEVHPVSAITLEP